MLFFKLYGHTSKCLSISMLRSKYSVDGYISTSFYLSARLFKQILMKFRRRRAEDAKHNHRDNDINLPVLFHKIRYLLAYCNSYKSRE